MMSGPTPPTYSYHRIDQPGVVAANTFISLLNPAGSGKVMLVIRGDVDAYAVGSSQTANSMHALSITAASGGTLLAASSVFRLRSDWPDSAVEVRHSNPSVTAPTGLPVSYWPPPITSGTGGNISRNVVTPIAGGVPFFPGEGLSFRTSAGNTNQRWNFSFIWAEVDI